MVTVIEWEWAGLIACVLRPPGSQMASMLHDTRRNDAYFKAIRHTVAAFRTAHGRRPLVLDIGTGTGLLVR